MGAKMLQWGVGGGKVPPALYIVACIEGTMDTEFVQPWLEKV